MARLLTIKSVNNEKLEKYFDQAMSELKELLGRIVF